VRAREVLLAMSSNDNWSRRRIAVRALGSVGSGEACRLVAGRLGDPHPAVRAAAADELAGMDPAQAVPPLVKMLADSDFDTRDTAARALGRIGRPAVHAVAGALAFPEAESGALRALERLPTDGEAKRIRKYADETLQRALRDYRYAAQLIDRGNERQQLLRDSLRRCAERQALNAIRAVALVSPDRPMLVEAIGNLDGGDHTQRAAALELIDSSKEASSLRPLVAIWEESTASRSPLEDPILELRHHPDPWIRECAEFALMSAKEGQMAQTLPTLSVMERVLFLRKVPIFEGLPPEDLKPLAAIAEEHVHSDGDVIVAQGEAADEMHIIVSGVVSVIVNGQETARRGSGDVVGEMAIILEQPRTATLSAAGDVRLLTIGQQEFCGILRERPETNLAVMRVLARRLAES
jgi:CRP/FNR family cyclic AMP-dependent transcriptional regulator